MTDDILLSVEDLILTLETPEGRLEALSHVSFSVKRGETFALVGESGCGKSLTASAILRLLPPGAETPSGRIRLGGDELLSLTERGMRRVRGRRASLVFQEPSAALDPVMPVGEQIAEMIREHKPATHAESMREAEAWLARVRLPDPARTARRFPHELSGGQKQRVMIALALSAEPELVVADEPTTALDVTLQAEVLALLKTLQKERGLTLLLITHDLAVVQSMADRLALMYAGEIVEVAAAAEFFRNPRHPYARALLGALPTADRTRPLLAVPGTVPPLDALPRGCRFAPRCAFASDVCRSAAPPFCELRSGERVKCHLCGAGRSAAQPLTPPKSSAAPTRPEAEARSAPPGLPEENAALEEAPLLSVRGLTVRFAGRGFFAKPLPPSVDDVSFDVHPGETVALVGESGSGKTTTGLALTALLDGRARVSGEVRLLGETLFSGEMRRLARASERLLRTSVQMIFQDPFASLDPRRTLRETLLEGLESLTDLTTEEREARVPELLEAVGLPASAADRLPHAFSGGQRQRVAIARALSVEPRLIVCDEPTSALDVSVQAQILNLLQEIQRTRRVAYLFITHNFAVVEYLADRILVMKSGRLVEAGPAERVLNAPEDPYTRKLLSSVPRLTLPRFPQQHAVKEPSCSSDAEA